MTGLCILKDGTVLEGKSFGAHSPTSGEMVFSTGMVGYPESLTDPSFYGQILILSYPVIGSYGVPDKKFWESDGIKVKGLIVSNYIDTPSHFQSKQTLSSWLKSEDIPALIIKDTRFLVQKIRDQGSTLGKIIFEKDLDFYNPDLDNLVSMVSPNNIVVNKTEEFKKSKNIIYIDCGGKNNIIKSFLSRNINVISVPHDFDPTDKKNNEVIKEILDDFKLKKEISGFIVSNGPGNPIRAVKTIEIVSNLMETGLPVFGICLGHQLIALASGATTKKLRFGHRSQNQPCIDSKTGRCYITTQNHGYAVSTIPNGFDTWFTNANDNSNEGIIHKKKPIFSIQFHPEANPGPMDAEWIFDYFIKKL